MPIALCLGRWAVAAGWGAAGEGNRGFAEGGLEPRGVAGPEAAEEAPRKSARGLFIFCGRRWGGRRNAHLTPSLVTAGRMRTFRLRASSWLRGERWRVGSRRGCG